MFLTDSVQCQEIISYSKETTSLASITRVENDELEVLSQMKTFSIPTTNFFTHEDPHERLVDEYESKLKSNEVKYDLDTLVCTNYTICFQVYVSVTSNNSNTYKTVFHKGSHAAQRSPAVFLSPKTHLFVSVSTSDVQKAFENSSTSKNCLNNDAWTHVAVVFKHRLMLLFVDGELDSYTRLKGIPLANDGPLIIGKTPFYPGFTGSMKNFRWYNKALTKYDIKLDAASSEPITQLQIEAETRNNYCMMTMMNQDNTSDVIFKFTDCGREYTAHKNLLIARSPFFNAMFSNTWAEAVSVNHRNMHEIEIKEDYEAFICMLEYIYTGQISYLSQQNISSDTLESLLLLSDKYQLPHLFEFCETQLCRRVTIYNVCSLIVLSDVPSGKAQTLRNLCIRFILDHYPEVIEIDLFYSLPKDVSQDIHREINKRFVSLQQHSGGSITSNKGEGHLQSNH